MLKKFLKNRRGTAEIIGSALFIVIILFFFSNVYLWHDQKTREMNNVLLERMNASVSMVATNDGVNVTNNGGVTFALSRLWILDGQESHYYADLNVTGHPIIWVVAGQTIQISLNSTAQPATGSPIDVTWDNTTNCPIVQYAPPEHGITLRILTEFGNTASCVVRRPNIKALGPTGDLWHVGDLVTLSGSNFEPASLITVKYDGIPVPTSPPQAQTSILGEFLDVEFNIPTSAFGNHILTVTDNGGSSASATLDVTPSLMVAIARSPTYTSLTVSGNGFAAGAHVDVYADVGGGTWAKAMVTGSFTASFNVGNESIITVTATDGSNSASIRLTVP